MCRTGGRRCPSHSNPEAVANRNARRRQAYADAHNGFGAPIDGPNPAINKLIAAMAQPKAEKVAAPLTEDSWKDFGFEDPHEIKPRAVSTKTYANMSKREMRALTNSEQNAIRIFTSNQYKWINGALYGKEDCLREDSFWGDLNIKSLDEMDPEETTVINRMCPSGLIEITDEIDDAMMKAPDKERILYRGKSGASPRLAANPMKYVQENYSLGQEVVFDGYQSASVDSGTAAAYSGGNGIVFEMKTSSGLNATHISHYSEEREVLLPRQTRWKVVGVHKDVKYTTYQDDGKTKAADAIVVQMIEVDEKGEPLVERQLPKPLTSKQLVDPIDKGLIGAKAASRSNY
jgi:hypothetical protein